MASKNPIRDKILNNANAAVVSTNGMYVRTSAENVIMKSGMTLQASIDASEPPDPDEGGNTSFDPGAPGGKSLSEIIASRDPGATVTVAEGSIADKINISKSIVLKGSLAGSNQNHDQIIS